MEIFRQFQITAQKLTWVGADKVFLINIIIIIAHTYELGWSRHYERIRKEVLYDDTSLGAEVLIHAALTFLFLLFYTHAEVL